MTDAIPQDAAADIEEISQQLVALREDLTRLAESVTGIVGRHSSALADDLAEGLEAAEEKVEGSGLTVEARLERSVIAHPLLAVGLAAAAGVLLGSMSRR